MLNEALTVMNWSFFCIVLIPRFARQCSSFVNFFRILDMFYTKTWDKVLFCTGVLSLAFRQWINGTVSKQKDGSYKLKIVLDGEVCNYRIEFDDEEKEWHIKKSPVNLAYSENVVTGAMDSKIE